MFIYFISDVTDNKVFYEKCAELEKRIPNLSKEPVLKDVDGSLSQIYNHAKGKVKVKNSYYEGDFYIESEFDLKPYLQ